MRWPESSRIDPAIATDGKTGRWALARVDSYTIPIDPVHEGPRGPAWRRRGQRVCYTCRIVKALRTTHATSPRCAYIAT
eukprot:7263879-Prymnesium_polylepis.1